MTDILPSSESSRIQTLSTEVRDIYEKYKDRIEEIIYNNYGVKKEDELLSLFKELGIILSERNNELLTFLEKRYGLQFKDSFDFSGGVKIDKSEVHDEIPESIKSFFSKNYTRQDDHHIYSRGYGYYMNFPGFETEGNNYQLEIGEYVQHLSEYYKDIIAYLGEFKGKQISELDDNEKKLLLIGLEHYKNLLLFIQNFIISVSDKEYLNTHVLNVSGRTFDNFFVDVSGEEDYHHLNSQLKVELEKVVSDFSDLCLGVNSDSTLNYNEGEFIASSINVIHTLYSGSFEKQETFMNRLKGKNQRPGKETDFGAIQKSMDRSNNKMVGKLLRIIREEDNPIKQLLACHNISQNIPESESNIDLVGILYGGIEMPYFMKYILTRFGNKVPEDVQIKLLGLSAYSNRNLMQTSALGNYKPINGGNDEKDNNPTLQLILDDNSFYGTSLQVASNIAASKGPVYSGVTEVGLRRGKVGKLDEGSNINHLLSKIPDAASVTPIEKNRGTYRNLVNRYVTKKLPGLIGKF